MSDRVAGDPMTGGSVELDPLETTLLDLLHALDGADLPLLLGGGYGLVLRNRYLQERGEPPLLKISPPLRSTNDLDIFLRTELLADSRRLIPLKTALDILGFRVIDSARHYQFARRIQLSGYSWDIKVDLLTRQPDPVEFPNLRFDARRVRPNPSLQLHAHTTPEARAVEDDNTLLRLQGRRSNGEVHSGMVALPSAYAFLMMKLFAFRDQWQQEHRDFGRKHALDIFSIVASITAKEFTQSQTLRERHRESAQGREAGRIASQMFGNTNASGAIRLREHPSFPGTAQMDLFLETIRELFPVNANDVGFQVSARHVSRSVT